MFGKLGIPELVLILAVALIIFGPRKLPEIGRSIGRGLREFKQATQEVSKNVSLEEEDETTKKEKKAAKAQEESSSPDSQTDQKEALTAKNLN